jgi:Xaa-Pro aminopeptidase
MKTDIDLLMADHNLDAMLVVGPGQHNPPMVYLTGGGHLTKAHLIKKRGHPPVLFHYPMERDEAARSGLQTRSLEEFQYQQLVTESKGDFLRVETTIYQRIFTDLGLQSGRIALYGSNDIGQSYAVLSELQKLMPGIELVGEVGRSMMLTAMSTKSPDEVERIRGIGRVATEVIGLVADFLTSHRVREQALVDKDGAPLTVGDVKRRINLWLAERGAENPEGTIFAIGHDGGVPHSTGNAGDVLRLGQTIVFDFFPREAGGGYYYDITRTWCLGYAPDEALALYEDVRHVYNETRNALRLDSPCRNYQILACDLFEARGHPTLRSNPGTTDGYVHTLGHGVGLYIHELPTFRATATDEERLLPGVVITVEPGLYYPDRGLGMRLEDTVWARPDGVFETLADYPLDLVLPVRS